MKGGGTHGRVFALQVGEPGLGKELFTKNIFAPYCADNDLPVNSCDPGTAPNDFRARPADFCTEVVVDVDDSRTKIHYLVQACGPHHQRDAPCHSH